MGLIIGLQHVVGGCNLGGSATHDILNIKNGDGSGSYNFGAIRMQTNNFGGSVRLDIVSDKPNSGMITIDDLHTWSTGTFVAINTLNVNADTYIKSLRYLYSWAAPNKGYLDVNVGSNGSGSYTKDLQVDSISFEHNGLHTNQGTIALRANNITLGTIVGRLSHILNVEADGNITANNVYFDGVGGVGGFATIPKSSISFTAKGGSFMANSVTGMGHSNVWVKAKDQVKIENVSFIVDICITEACAGLIQLESTNNDVIVGSVSGGTSNESGIGSFNTLKVIGNNFYAGHVEAISLVTALNNSYLDLSGVRDTTFIDNLEFRNGTLKVQDFHFNNFTVWKANANRVGFEHPTDGSAYTTVSENIGKSFINNLSMEIGTSHTADSAALWFKGGGDILNINFVAARPTSYINFGDIKQVNINELSAMEADIYMKTGIFNTITNKKGQTIITNGASKIVANALNVNELLHIKDSSKHSGVMRIELSDKEDVNQDFS
ncbi:MAG: autotransporter domain-containing protein, partial [Helicobacter trogontum]|nr:autotransporter domain-containing protein [Helicobacter trogontum]